MEDEIYSIQPQNLPVYIYRLDAMVAFTVGDEAFLHRGYGSIDMRLITNLPIRKGMFFRSSDMSKGNENVDLIEHMKEKKVLGGAEKELDRFYGCSIVHVVHQFVDPKDIRTYHRCGAADGLVFVPLTLAKTGERYRKIHKKYNDSIEELTEEENTFFSWFNEADQNSVDFWKTQIPDWDKRLRYIGKMTKYGDSFDWDSLYE